MNLVGVGIEPTFRVFQARANPSQLSDRENERAVRLELTNTGFAIRRLSHLATRASFGTEGEIRTLKSSLEDSHVSSYITSACDASRATRVWLWGENFYEDGRGGQNRTVTTSSQDSDADVTPHPEWRN